jgi:hypothetical protein
MVTKIFGQPPDESKVLNLSNSIFRWEVENKIDSLESILHEKFFVVSSAGSIQNKKQYIERLRSGNFIHNNIEIEENMVTLSDNTAVVIGKGKFTVSVSGQKSLIHLSYLEVFTRPDSKDAWEMISLKANTLEK